MAAGYPFRGSVVYADHALDIPPRAVDARFSKHLDYFINLIASESPPLMVPNARECLYCDITETDCTSRVKLPLVHPFPLL